MAYDIEYLLAVNRSVVMSWLSRFDGWLQNENIPPELVHGEFQSWFGFDMLVDIAESASRLSFPRLIYSHLLFAGPVIGSFVEQIEEHLCDELIGVPIIRVCESQFDKWEHANGGEWWKIPRPLDSLREWLRETQEDARYYRVLESV